MTSSVDGRPLVVKVSTPFVKLPATPQMLSMLIKSSKNLEEVRKFIEGAKEVSNDNLQDALSNNMPLDVIKALISKIGTISRASMEVAINLGRVDEVVAFLESAKLPSDYSAAQALLFAKTEPVKAAISKFMVSK